MDDGIAEALGEIADTAREQVRAGSRSLLIFSYSLNASVLRAHSKGPLCSAELEEEIPWAPQSSLRAAVGNLCELGILTRLETDAGPSRAPTKLTVAGYELLPVAEVLDSWLKRAPDGPIELESPAARGTVRILTAGWDSTMVRTLAERPLTLTEMSAGISYLSYPALKRRLAKLRSTRLVTPTQQGKSAAYAASDWLRLAVVPLAVAGHWELLHDPGAEPISRIEVEAAFLLTLPLVELPREMSGACNLSVLTSVSPDRADRELAGVRVQIEQGELIAHISDRSLEPSTWALGTPDAWLEAVIHNRYDALRIDGENKDLPRKIVEGIHVNLFKGFVQPAVSED